MSSMRTAIASGVRATLLLLLIAGVFLLVRSVAPGAAIVGAVQRLVTVATRDSTQMHWLLLICAAAGLFVLADRRRRARVRQAAA